MQCGRIQIFSHGFRNCIQFHNEVNWGFCLMDWNGKLIVLAETMQGKLEFFVSDILVPAALEKCFPFIIS